MKKSLFYTLGAIGIMALIALNVYVVTSKETPAFLKWDAMSYIFAKGNSESGSGSGSASGSLECICVDCPDEEYGCYSYIYGSQGNDGYEGSQQCEGPGKIERNVIDRNPDACK